MAGDKRRKDVQWQLTGEPVTLEQAQLAVLMDIRDELKRLNDRLYCEQVSAIPRVLRRISFNTAQAAEEGRRVTDYPTLEQIRARALQSRPGGDDGR